MLTSTITIILSLIACASALPTLTVDDEVKSPSKRTCPFTGLWKKAEAGVTLENSQIVRNAKRRASESFCGPPLCDPAAPTGRRLLSKANVEMHSNGYPVLYEGTVSAIEESFCAILPGGCTTNSDGDYNGLGAASDYKADFSRGDITAGAIQLAFHDAGEYDPNNTTYPAGPDGCACAAKLENAGLDYIKGILDPIYEQYQSYLSLGDFWVICANVAILVSRPTQVDASTVTAALDFKYGRPDHADCDNCLAEVADRLPNAELSLDHVVDVFQTRMGFSNSEIVALMGAHSLGRMQMANSGHEGIWDQTMARFDTRYYIAILSFRWCRYVVDQTDTPYESHGPFHEWRIPSEMDEAADYYTNSTPKLLNTDMCLAWDIGDGDAEVNTQTCATGCMTGTNWNADDDQCTTATFTEGQTVNFCQASTTSPESPSGALLACDKNNRENMRSYVETFASDTNGETFMPQFADAFKKLTELGVSDLTTPTAGSCTDEGDNCRSGGEEHACCDSALTCYQKGTYYGKCLSECPDDSAWDCYNCVDSGTNCRTGGVYNTCCDASLTCYAKAQYYGLCLTADEYAAKGWDYEDSLVSVDVDAVVPEKSPQKAPKKSVLSWARTMFGSKA